MAGLTEEQIATIWQGDDPYARVEGVEACLRALSEGAPTVGAGNEFAVLTGNADSDGSAYSTVQLFAGEGVPVDYTDGTPPATGEGVAEIGSLYVDQTNGKLYINGGTKAEPIWKIVTSAA